MRVPQAAGARAPRGAARPLRACLATAFVGTARATGGLATAFLGAARATPGRAAVIAAVLAGATLATDLEGQERDRLRQRCEAGSGAPAEPARCLTTALLAEAVVGGAGLALAGGSELPGSASTLGRRYGTTPRWALAGRAGIARFDRPGLGVEDGESLGAWVPSFQGELAIGAFDGFRLGPTVGGFLSVDLFATLGVALLPTGAGFDGATTAWGYGARLGILRESFTAPGLTLSAARRQGADFRFGPEEGPGVEVDDLTVTSVRATVGKEFIALGVLGGLGWDRVAADGVLHAVDGARADLDGFSEDRLLIFGAVTRTWLVVQLTVEGGFATGFDEAPEGFAGAYDPSGGSLFGGVSFRVLF